MIHYLLIRAAMCTTSALWHKVDSWRSVYYEPGAGVLTGPFRPLCTNSKEDA
ncbi:hypothetical protein NB716_004207 [Pantoea ananatis]|nr:hypothetical protein [Pantoea ananatis]